MKSNLKKIIIFVDNNKLEKVIVVKNNLITTYNSSKYSSDELLKIYSNNVRELKDLNKDIINGLSAHDAINKLSIIGKIEYNKKNLITNVRIDDIDTPTEKIIVEYENKSVEFKLDEFKSYDEYKKIKDAILLELCNIYDVEYNDLAKLGLLHISKNIEEKNKIKNLVIRNKSLLSKILIGAITVTGLGVEIAKLSKSHNNDSKKISKVIETVKPQENTNIPYESINPTIPIIYETVAPTRNVSKNVAVIEKNTPPAVIHDLQEIMFISNSNIFKDYQEVENNIVAKKINNNKIYKKNKDLASMLSEFNKIRKQNMDNLSNEQLISIDDLVLIYYENLLLNDDCDTKAFVKYFSMIGNQIIKNAYENRFDQLIKCSGFSSREFIRLIKNNEPLEVLIDGVKKDFYYKDLPIESQELILNIIWENNKCLKNVSVEYNDIEYDSFDISQLIIEEKDIRNKLSEFTDSNNNIDNKKYEKYLEEFKELLFEFKDRYQDYIESNNDIKQNLDDNYSEYFKEYNTLSNQSNENYILENYESNTDPFKSRFSQGNSGYGSVKFEGKTIKRSGCGICAFASGISCCLTLEYDTNISVNPKVLLDELKKIPVRHYYRGSNGLNWGSDYSFISEDITEVFEDMSIIELSRKSPTFDTETLEMITQNYPVVVSLYGRGHIVCVTKSAGNGKFYVSDPDRGYSKPISINTSIVRSDGRKKGTIKGKKGWILIPNKDIKIIGNEIKIKGLDLSKLPPIGRFETKGQSFEVSINTDNNSLIIPVDTLEKESNGIKK